MENKKKYIAWAIRIIVAFLFIISAVAKLYPSPYFAISTFEVKQLYTLGFSEQIAPFFSRTLIGIEFALGLLLLQNHWLKKFIIPVTILLLLVFIGHLTYVTLKSGGNTGNCGCFGELLPMTPFEAIVKNIIAVGLLAYLYKLLPQKYNYGNFWVLTTVLFASILGIFMLAPIQPPASNFTVTPIQETPIDSTEEVVIPLPIDSTTATVTPVSEETKEEAKKTEKTITTEPTNVKSGNAKYFASIDKGKKILCYFVPGCDHCREAAKEITEMRKQDKNFPPVSVLFMDEEPEKIPDFFKEAGANYPFKVIGIIEFWKVLGNGKDTPGIKYLWNGNEVKYWWGITDNQFHGADLKPYLTKTKEELKLK